MAFELQMQSSVLTAIVARLIQSRLRSRCFPPVGPVFIDHIDVAPAPIALFQVGAAIRAHVPLELFTVLRSDLLAAPNATPKGATGPPLTGTVIVEIAAAGTAISAQPIGFGEALDQYFPPKLIDRIEIELGALANRLRLGAPKTARVELVGPLVAFRFDPTEPAGPHLFPGQQWGLFLDELTMEEVVAGRVRKAMAGRVTSLELEAHWRPDGDRPHVDIDYGGKPVLADGLSADVEGTVFVDLSLTGSSPRSLHFDCDFTLSSDSGTFVPDFIEDAIESTFINPQVYVALLLATADRPLPDVPFDKAKLVCASLLAAPSGMTLGGPVLLPPEPRRDITQMSVGPFSLPMVIEFCSQRRDGGRGPAPISVAQERVSVFAQASFDACGGYCGVEFLPGSASLKPCLVEPAPRTAGEAQAIALSVPAALATTLAAPVQLIVGTGRGVRLVDFGLPPHIEYDGAGNVLNARVSFIDDCLYFTEDSPFLMHWGEAGLTKDLVDPPLEDPNWSQWLNAIPRLGVQLVTLLEIEPGELIRFRSRDHAIDATADSRGRLVVPAMLPLSRAIGARLERASGRPIARFDVQAAILSRETGLQDGVAGEAKRARAQPPRRRGASWRDAQLDRLGIPGLKSVFGIAGFPEAPVAFATVEGGGQLLLQRDGRGNVRVAGTVSGPVGPIETADDGTDARPGGGPGRFRVLRPPGAGSRPAGRGVQRAGVEGIEQ